MRAAIVFILLLTATLRTPAQDSLRFLSGTTGAACYALKNYGNYLVTGTGATLRIYDKTPGIPYDTIWEYRYRSTINDLVIRNQYLYVAANYDGLTKWDLTNPANPQPVFQLGVASMPGDAPVLDVSLAGDTIYLARYSHMSAYRDLGSAYNFIADFGAVTGFGKLWGADVKNGIIAYTVSDPFSQNGVYLYDAATLTQLGHYPQTFCWPENVIWGQDNDLLHVLGGTNSVNGHFYTLDVGNPANPQMIFSDTVNGAPFGFAVAGPLNAEIRNDTIYVATNAGLRPGGPLDTTFIHVYDATNPGNVHLAAYHPAGLWHFDVTLDWPYYHVASEWYGILTVDISDFHQPAVMGRTLTGGWSLSSHRHGSRLAVGNEGYGLKLYDISDPTAPVLQAVDQSRGFCMRVRFSDSGDYLYASYLSVQGFRVFDAQTLMPVDSIATLMGVGLMETWQDRVYLHNDNNLLRIIDVSNPAAVSIQATEGLQLNDMVAAGGRLYVTSDDSIRVFDISGGAFSLQAFVALPANEDAGALAVYGTEVFVYVANKGLVRYDLVFLNPGYALVEQNTYPLAAGEPAHMAADTFGLYVAYRVKGLHYHDRQTMVQKDFYRGELDLKGYANQWGVQDVYCDFPFIFLSEYFSQTTILTVHDTLPTGIASPQSFSAGAWPNPFVESVNIRLPAGWRGPVRATLYDAGGRTVNAWSSGGGKVIRIPRGTLGHGLYFYRLHTPGRADVYGKVIAR